MINDIVGKTVVSVVHSESYMAVHLQDAPPVVYRATKEWGDSDVIEGVDVNELDFETKFSLDLITREAYDAAHAARRARENDYRSSSDRETYERLKAIFEPEE